MENGWNLYDLETHKIFVSRDVEFIEDQFPFSNISSPFSPPPLPLGFYIFSPNYSSHDTFEIFQVLLHTSTDSFSVELDSTAKSPAQNSLPPHGPSPISDPAVVPLPPAYTMGLLLPAQTLLAQYIMVSFLWLNLFLFPV